jgi:hypothetical protein
MRKFSWIFFLAILICLSPSRSHSQAPSNMLRRVLMLQVGQIQGTGFSIDVDGRQYLVTAKHVIAALKTGTDGTIQIKRGDSWVTLNVKAFLCEGNIDIAVLVPPRQITVSEPLEMTMDSMFVGQEVFFGGYPYGLHTSGAANALYPIAFIKKAVFSAPVVEDGIRIIYLDGFNNPGFSGGPVVYQDMSTHLYSVAGVVSGYQTEFGAVYNRVEIKQADANPDDVRFGRVISENGHWYRLDETQNLVRMNTGIIRATNIAYAVELIRKNPIGPITSPSFQP